MRAFNYNDITSFGDGGTGCRSVMVLVIGVVVGGLIVVGVTRLSHVEVLASLVGDEPAATPDAGGSLRPPSKAPVTLPPAEEILAPVAEYLRTSEQERQRLGRELRATQRFLKGAVTGQLHLVINEPSRMTLELVYVPPGRFLMGRTDEEVRQANRQTNALQHDASGPQHLVDIAEGYFIGRTEVTVKQYRTFWRAAGKKCNLHRPQPLQAADVGDTLPITDVTWPAAIAFCTWLSQRTGYTVRLPTEVEWEYAARGRGGLVFARADGKPYSNPRSITAPRAVGAGETDISWCGAHDLCGNVSEWCFDAYREDAYRLDDDAPAYRPLATPEDNGPAPSGAAERVYRGGAFDDHHVNCEAATRRRKLATTHTPYLGFRVVVVVPARELGVGSQSTPPENAAANEKGSEQ